MGKYKLKIFFRISNKILPRIKGDEAGNLCDFRIVDGVCGCKVDKIYRFGLQIFEF